MNEDPETARVSTGGVGLDDILGEDSTPTGSISRGGPIVASRGQGRTADIIPCLTRSSVRCAAKTVCDSHDAPHHRQSTPMLLPPA